MTKWTADDIEKLRRAWTDGKTAGQIAALYPNLTRNSIIGKAHRLGLAKRESPITGPVRSQKKVRADTQGGVAPMAETKPEPKPESPPVDEPNEPVRRGVEPAIPAGVLGSAGAEALAVLPRGACRWPIGDPHEKGFKFCGAKAIVGRPYCEEHSRRAMTVSRAPEVA